MTAKTDNQIKAMNALSGILLLALLLGVGGVLWKALDAFDTMTASNTKMMELAYNATEKMGNMEAETRELKVRIIALEATGRVTPKKRRASHE